MSQDTASNQIGTADSSRLLTAAIILFVLLVTAGFFTFWTEIKTFLKGGCYAIAPESVCSSDTIRLLAGGYIWGLLALPMALTLERYFPAREQPLLSNGLRQDVIWFVLHGLFKYTLFAAFASGLYLVFDNYLSFMRLTFISAMPVPAQIILVVLLSDFLEWLHHLIRHKVPLFWRFHAVHHSQREMNYFCDSRIHPLDAMIGRSIGFIPFFSLELDTAIPSFFIWQVIQSWYTNLNHSNLKFNYGWLRYVLVTPQSHRIHHSMEPEHRDKNFAVMFSIWDFIFGTQHLDFDEYPQTGIEDERFPIEKSGRTRSLLRSTIGQLIYPFLPSSKS